LEYRPDRLSDRVIRTCRACVRACVCVRYVLLHAMQKNSFLHALTVLHPPRQ